MFSLIQKLYKGIKKLVVINGREGVKWCGKEKELSSAVYWNEERLRKALKRKKPGMATQVLLVGSLKKGIIHSQ